MSLEWVPHEHPEWKNKHSFWSPSSHRLDKKDWIDWSDADILDYIISTLRKDKAADIGTIIHAEAAWNIAHKMRIKTKSVANYDIQKALMKADIPEAIINPAEFAETYMEYVNDGIGYNMYPEVPVGIGDSAFGSIDAISFDYKTKFLRIHDLKTGSSPTRIEQLIAYAAYICLEYKLKPGEIKSELRIYQSGEIVSYEPTATDLLTYMERIRRGSDIYKRVVGQALSVGRKK